MDDIIRTGDKQFENFSQKTKELFEMGESESLPCSFTGFSISRDKDGDILIDQHAYLRRLE